MTGMELIGFGAFTPVSGGTLLLDSLSAAPVSAYSLRKLRAAYAGSCIKVRRSSDNATQDIGFSGSNLDTAAMLAFCGAGDGFVDTWYDQKNANNLVQATAINQLQIVSSGAVLAKNTKPCLNSSALVASASIAGVTAFNSLTQFSASVVGSFDTTGGDRMAWFIGSGQTDDYSSDTSCIMFYRTGTSLQTYRNGALSTSAGITSNQLFTGVTVFDGANNTLERDGAAASAVAKTAALGAVSVTMGVGSSLSGNANLAYIGEFIVWASALGGTDRSALQVDQKAYWGTP